MCSEDSRFRRVGMLTNHSTFRSREMSSDLWCHAWLATIHFVSQALHFSYEVSEGVHSGVMNWLKRVKLLTLHISIPMRNGHCVLFIRAFFNAGVLFKINQRLLWIWTNAKSACGDEQAWSWAILHVLSFVTHILPLDYICMEAVQGFEVTFVRPFVRGFTVTVRYRKE